MRGRGLRERRRPAKNVNNLQKINKKCSKSHDFEHFYIILSVKCPTLCDF